MRQIPLAGIDTDTLRPLSPQQVARRAQIAACMRLAAAVLLGIGCAELIAHAADAFGAAYLSR